MTRAVRSATDCSSRRRSQVVRQRFAKPPFVSSSLTGASKKTRVKRSSSPFANQCRYSCWYFLRHKRAPDESFELARVSNRNSDELARGSGAYRSPVAWYRPRTREQIGMLTAYGCTSNAPTSVGYALSVVAMPVGHAAEITRLRLGTAERSRRRLSRASGHVRLCSDYRTRKSFPRSRVCRSCRRF